MSESRFKLNLLESGLAGALRPALPLPLDQLRFENLLHVLDTGADTLPVNVCETVRTAHTHDESTTGRTSGLLQMRKATVSIILVDMQTALHAATTAALCRCGCSEESAAAATLIFCRRHHCCRHRCQGSSSSSGSRSRSLSKISLHLGSVASDVPVAALSHWRSQQTQYQRRHLLSSPCLQQLCSASNSILNVIHTILGHARATAHAQVCRVEG
jgi:hypothetical protein